MKTNKICKSLLAIALLGTTMVCPKAYTEVLKKSEVITKESHSGPVSYVVTENTEALEFTLSEGNVKATTPSPGNSWSIQGENTLGDCSGSVTFRRDMTGNEIPEDLFVTKMSGTYVICDGEGGGSLDETPLPYEYELTGTFPIYIDPEDSTEDNAIALGEWLPLTARNRIADNAVEAMWGNTANVLYTEENVESEYTDEVVETTYFMSSQTGDFSINAVPEGEHYRQGASAEITVKGEVSLEALEIEENSPALAAGLICLNAQDEYKKAKWKAIIEDDDDSATVTIISGDVTFEGGATTLNLTNSASGAGLEFFVVPKENAAAETYELKIEHEQGNISSNASGVMFKFVGAHEIVQLIPSQTANGQVTEEEHAVSGSTQYADVGSNNGGDLIIKGKYYVHTTPEGSYNGNVDASFEFGLRTISHAITVKRHLSGFDGTYEISLNWKFISVTFGSHGCAGSIKGGVSINNGDYKTHRIKYDNTYLANFIPDEKTINTAIQVTKTDPYREFSLNETNPTKIPFNFRIAALSESKNSNLSVPVCFLSHGNSHIKLSDVNNIKIK